MQTERDKQRVLDGLEGAAAGGLDRAAADRILSSLTKRVFLLHNVHEQEPVVFHSRWAMSYMRGPLTRDHIRALTAQGTQPQAPAAAAESVRRTPAGVSAPPAAASGQRPVVPPAIQQFFVPRLRAPDDLARSGSADASAVYAPVLLGAARVTFEDAKLGVTATEDLLVAAPFSEGAVAVDWATAATLHVETSQLLREPDGAPSFAPLPSAAADPRNYAKWEKSFASWVAQNQRLALLRHADSKLTSRPGESEREFRVRVHEASRAARDSALDAVRRKFAARRAALAEKLRRADAAVAREGEQASHQKVQTAVSFGATVLGALFGRKAASTSTLGRATTAARGVGRTMKEASDVKRASENREAVQQQLEELDKQIATETDAIVAAYAAEPALDRVAVASKRGQVAVQFVALGWIPAPGA
jgi:hypothetical protein